MPATTWRDATARRPRVAVIPEFGEKIISIDHNAAQKYVIIALKIYEAMKKFR